MLSYVHTPSNLQYTYETIPARLQFQAELNGGKEVYVFLDPDGTRTSTTARALHEESLKYAKALVRLGIRKGDVVALCLRNDYEGLLWLFSVIYAGGIVMNINSEKEDGSDLKGVLSRAGAKAFIINPGTSNGIFKACMHFIDDFERNGSATSEAIPTLKYFLSVKTVEGEVLLTTHELLYKGAEKETELPRIDPNDISHMFLTSGSTGEPKFIQVSHFQTVSTCKLIPGLMNSDPGDSMYTERKFAWMGGFPYMLLHDATTVVTKTTAIPSMEEHCKFTLDAIMKENCQIAGLFPATIIGLTDLVAERQLETPLLKSVNTGGLPVTGKCYAGIGKLASVISNCYGSTEAGVIAALHATEITDNLDYNTGQPVPGVEVKVVGSDGFVVKRGERGAIYVRSPTLFNEYYGNPGKTKEVLSASRWFNTDDTGYIDQDGNLIVSGRQSDIILQGGRNIVATSVEGFIKSHLDVADVVVVPVPDDAYFQLVCACIIPKQGTNLSAEDVREYYKSKYFANATEAFGGWSAGSGLAPRLILFFDEFPRLYNDKPDKKKLIDEAIRRKSEMAL